MFKNLIDVTRVIPNLVTVCAGSQLRRKKSNVAHGGLSLTHSATCTI